ncbi:MAG: DedA family protein [Leptolyngbyaceae cyanobacterium]
MLAWISDWLESLGYLGVFALMVLEHLFPPIPSELVMPLSGFISSRSAEMNLVGVIIAGSIGSVVGTLFWYWLGRWTSQEQLLALVAEYGKWLTVKPRDIEKAIVFFQEGGGQWVVGIGRVVPGVRTYVSIPAGLGGMQILPYLIYSSIGTVIWTAALAISGYLLGDQFERVGEFIGPISKGVLVALFVGSIAWLSYRLVKRQRHT